MMNIVKDSEEIIKEIRNRIRGITNQFVNKPMTSDTLACISSNLNSFLKSIISQGRLDDGISAKVDGDKDTANIHFYYGDKELYLVDISNLIDFNPNDYYYVENDQIYHYCPNSITFTLSLDEEKPTKMIQIHECKKCPYMQLRSKRRNLGVCDNLDLDLSHDEENFELKDNYIPDWCPLENYKKVDEVKNNEK